MSKALLCNIIGQKVEADGLESELSANQSCIHDNMVRRDAEVSIDVATRLEIYAR